MSGPKILCPKNIGSKIISGQSLVRIRLALAEIFHIPLLKLGQLLQGQMLLGQMLLGQMSPRDMTSFVFINYRAPKIR